MTTKKDENKKNVRIAAAVIVFGIFLVVCVLLLPSSELGKIQITFYITFAVALVVCGIGIVLLFVFLPDDKRPVLIFATTVAAGIAAILSAFYIGQTLKVSTQRDKITRSVKIISEIDGPHVTSVRHFILTTLDVKTMSSEEIYEAIESNKELWNSVRLLLNNVEKMSLAIQINYADEEFLYRHLEHMVPYYYVKLKPFIDGIRRKYDNKSMYIEYEKLVHAWESHRFLSTGKRTPPLE